MYLYTCNWISTPRVLLCTFYLMTISFSVFSVLLTCFVFFSHKISNSYSQDKIISFLLNMKFMYLLRVFILRKKCSWVLKIHKPDVRKRLCSVCFWISVTLLVWFSEKQGQNCCQIPVSSIYAFVFLSGLWERMTNDTEGSTSRSLKLRERYDLSLWLTCAISLHTYSNSWLNPSRSLHHFSISVHLHSPCFDLYSRIKICCIYKGAI